LVAGVEFCCNDQPAEADGHDTIIPLPEQCMVNAGVEVGGGKIVEFVNTMTVLSLKFALIKSGRPSPLTSAIANENGLPPTAGEAASAKLPMPSLVKTESVPR